MYEIKNFFLDIVFPRHCLGCDILLKDASSAYVCKSCLRDIPFALGFACAFCRSPVIKGKTCPFCARTEYLDRLIVAASYENQLVKKVLKTIKYRFILSLTSEVAILMSKYLKKKAPWLAEDNSLILVPVPLHKKRFNWRGFNQSEAIALKLGQTFGWRVITNLLKRSGNRLPQASIEDKATRIQNTQGIFVCPPSNVINSKKVLLIDDISTTGSTLNDCARALKNAGASEVIGFVFARNSLERKISNPK